MKVIHPIFVRDIIIPSNIFFAPINPGYSKQGFLDKPLYDFHINHSGKGIGIYYVGNISMHKTWSSNSNTAIISASETALWKRLTCEITNKGSIPGIQLAWKPEAMKMQRSFITDNLNDQILFFKDFYKSFDEIEYVASIYVDSIIAARSLGFKVVQIHGAHGYGLSLLMSRTVSDCTDPVQSKGVYLLKQMLRKIEQTDVLTDIILDIRVSLYEGMGDTVTELDYKMKLCHILVELGFDIISLSNGFYNIDKRMIYPSKNSGTVILEEAITLAQLYPTIVWNVSGNMEKVLSGKRAFPSNLSFSIGRQIISDPDTLIKLKSGAIESIDWCNDCGACHYYSNGKEGIQPCKKY